MLQLPKLLTMALMRLVICVAMVMLSIVPSAYAFQGQIEDKVKAEIDKHEKLLEEIKLSVDSWATSAKDKARKAGKSGKGDSLLEIQKQVERFNRYGSLPDSTSLQMQGSRLWKSFLNVQKVSAEVTQDLVKAGKQAEADAIKEEFKRFFDKHDPFPNGSVWTGRVSTRTSDTTVKSTEQSVTVVFTGREQEQFSFRAEHNDLRHWQFTFAQAAQVYKATKAEFIKQPNPNLSKLLGTREVVGSDFKYNGTVLELSIIRTERNVKTTFSYVLTRTPS
jgi:cell division protein FtsL